jgi:tetratricopeptide (TPR) repeat protein
MRKRVTELESHLANDPDSYDLRTRLLSAYAEDEEGHGDPRRIEHIRWFIRNHPEDAMCRTPFVHVHPDRWPDAYASLREEWQRTLAAHPTSADVVCAAANFLALSDREHALGLLRDAIGRTPSNGALWAELGRLSADPAERLSHFQVAHRLGNAAGTPNLLVWIARTGAEAADYTAAESAARELMASVSSARAQYGPKLDWPERGELWTRACRESESEESASDLISAISDHAYRKHWAHTVLGLVAHARGDLDVAAQHLHDSAQLAPDFRLSAYGPSIDLARALCMAGRWSDAASYFERWTHVWDDDRARRCKSQVDRRELPRD